MWLLTLTEVTTPEVTTPDEAKEASTILTVVAPCPPDLWREIILNLAPAILTVEIPVPKSLKTTRTESGRKYFN